MADPDRPTPWRALPRPGRVIVLTLASLALLVGALALAVNLYVTPERVEAIINGELEQVTDGRYEVRLESVRIGVLGRSVTLGGFSLLPTGVAEEEASYQVEVEHFRAGAIDLWPLWRHRQLEVGSVRLTRPHVEMETVESEEEVEFEIEDLLALAEEEPLRGTRVGTFRIEDASVEGTPAEGFEALRHTAEGLSVTVNDFHLVPEAAEDEDRFLFTRDIDIDLDHYHVLTADELYQAELGNLSASSRDSTASVELVSLEPAVDDEAIFATEPWGITRYEVELRLLDAAGIDFKRMLAEMAVHARSVTVDTLHADLFHQETEIDPPVQPPPHEMVQEMESSIAVDEMHVNHAFLQYAMTAPGAEEPGVLTIEDAGLSAQHLFLSPDEQAEQPAAFEMHGLIQGEGLLEARLEYDLTNPDFALDLSASLGEMPFTAFNEMLLNAFGVRFDSGGIHEADVELTGRGNITEAELQFLYENLELEIVDVLRPGFVEELAEVVANELLRTDTIGSEEEDDPPHMAAAEAEREEGDSFAQFLTAPIIEALLDILGRDRLPV